ncbi:MAG: hypothetical protein OHK93_005393 [Ramalina farinacea]|uniref:Nephrocystin 3-like N-terminal domain-containing protein n=1 Tax=Ramalina farinacea TaxID=258253 RepID=A0AA43QY78_9LECA|nr:hypothetical protein [Ramalina farinacea]
MFRHLEDALSSHTFEEKEESLVNSVGTSITNCNDLIRKLQDKYQKFAEVKEASPTLKDSFKLKGRQVAYPFRKPTLLKLDEDISKIQENVSFALNVLQLNDAQKLHKIVAEIQANVDSMRIQQIPRYLTDWLEAPDVTIDHNAARDKKFKNTGRWLIESPAFVTWLKEENSMIWVKGLPGSGKSILCSTAIEAVWQQRRGDSQIGVAFFYFTFNDSAKQDVSSMIRPLLLQLSSQLQDGHANLVQLYESHTFGLPPSTVLLDCLRNLILKFRHVYILVDALDESPRSGSQEAVLEAMETLRNWGLQGLHLFVTSRDERDIGLYLDVPTTRQITMQNREVADDIANFINGRLEDRIFKKLSPWGGKIREALTKGAGGV